MAKLNEYVKVAATEAAIVEAQKHILEAHAERLTAELVEAKKTGKAPAWVDEFKWPFSFNRDPTGSVSGDDVATPNALPVGSRLDEGSKTVVTYDDTVAGRAPRPRVLDMFAGGGAIPLEALRLGCEAYALDLNPVAHIIQLCTLVYPQKYGKPDPTVRGMTGPPLRSARVSDPAETADRRSPGSGPRKTPAEETFGPSSGSVGDRPQRFGGGLAAEVRYWGNWVLERVRKEIGDLYPPIPDPEVWDTPPEIAFDHETGQWKVTKAGKPKSRTELESLTQTEFLQDDDGDGDDDSSSQIENFKSQIPPGFLQPVAYLWTRTVRCKNPGCAATVPLVKQTWLCKKAKRVVVLQTRIRKATKEVEFDVVEASTTEQLGCDPAERTGADAVCPFCGTVADTNYLMNQGAGRRFSEQLLALVCRRANGRGKLYVSTRWGLTAAVRDQIDERYRAILSEQPSFQLKEPISPLRPSPNARGLSGLTRYGISSFGQLFTARQTVLLASISMNSQAIPLADESRRRIILAFMAILVGRVANQNCSVGVYHSGRETIEGPMGDKKVPMVWDFPETDPFSGATGSVKSASVWIGEVCESLSRLELPSLLNRGSATALSWADGSVDAVVTDPPYYDNVPYADLADFFYVWFRRVLKDDYPEHFATDLCPKRSELTALASRHAGDMAAATTEYESQMLQALREASRVLKPGGPMTIVYAHKTTLGWSTLVDALRSAGFTVTEAWPLDTEMAAGKVKIDRAMLASSIFLVVQTRENAGVGNYEDDVQADLQQIVRERVETLWDMGIAGADLVIACVGAGLRAFTKYEKVEYANGEEVPAEKFLAEVEGVVLDTMMGKLFGQSGAAVSAIDAASRFYVLWRFVYKAAEIDAGEAIVFTYAQHVELDGPQGLSGGKDALVEKKKAKYRARDFTERGDNARLGQTGDDGQPAPLIDVLHRVLWLMENSPRKLAEFLTEVQPDHERLRVLAQTLAGAALSGKSEEDAAKLVSTTAAEQAALGKLLANWRAVIENAVVSKAEREDRKRGQERLFE